MEAARVADAEAEEARALLERLAARLLGVIRGKPDAVALTLLSFAAGGHVLLEDIPGVGKTTLAKALALAVGGTFKRVQFTPDLLPTDIVGSSVYDPRDGTFSFKPGPVFANVLLADEINRASPRTQSALLEAMSEGQVTVDGVTHPLPATFFTVATQNPVEYHGTYPLPEAQLDRFTVRLALGYPPEEEEHAVLLQPRGADQLRALTPAASPDDLLRLQRAAEAVHLEPTVGRYLMGVVHATRAHESIRLGVSVRGALQYGRMARARALSHGRSYVLPEDVRALAAPVLAHRLLLDVRARYAGVDKGALVEELAARVPVPR